MLILKVMSGKKVVDAIKVIMSTKGLSLGCARFLHESMLVPIIVHGYKTMV